MKKYTFKEFLDVKALLGYISNEEHAVYPNEEMKQKVVNTCKLGVQMLNDFEKLQESEDT